ncbi:MAG: glycosyltransferase [Hyphomicrobiaceae bacterium]
MSGSTKRVAIVGPSGRNIALLRGPLIRDLAKRDVAITCIAPSFSTDDEARLAALGADRATFDAAPRGPRFLADWQITRQLAETLKVSGAEAVLAFGSRTLCLTLLAARRAGVGRRVALFNQPMMARGLRFDDMAADDVAAHAVTEAVAQGLVRRALGVASALVFHNRDEMRRLKRANLLPAQAPCETIPGAGVDLAAFTPAPLPGLADGVQFLMIATLDRRRGVLDYCTAAAALAQRAPHARFLLAGPAGDGPTGLSPDALRPYGGAVTFLGPLSDVRDALARCHVFVYPSSGEGMPRALMEAAACGRPVVTTASPGCREAVDDRVNGCLVPPGNPPALEEAMASYLKRPDLLPAMSRASRLKAERHFDEQTSLAQLRIALGIV